MRPLASGKSWHRLPVPITGGAIFLVATGSCIAAKLFKNPVRPSCVSNDECSPETHCVPLELPPIEYPNFEQFEGFVSGFCDSDFDHNGQSDLFDHRYCVCNEDRSSVYCGEHAARSASGESGACIEISSFMSCKDIQCPRGRRCLETPSGGQCVDMAVSGKAGTPCDEDIVCEGALVCDEALCKLPRDGSVGPETSAYGPCSSTSCDIGLQCWEFLDVPVQCVSACSTSDDCPSAPSMTTSPVCVVREGDGVCALSCEDGLRCPSGMYCRTVRADAGTADVCFPVGSGGNADTGNADTGAGDTSGTGEDTGSALTETGDTSGTGDGQSSDGGDDSGTPQTCGNGEKDDGPFFCFAPAMAFSLGVAPSDIVVADFDDDDATDLVVLSGDAQTVVLQCSDRFASQAGG